MREHTISFGDRLNEIYNFVIYTKQSENVIKNLPYVVEEKKTSPKVSIIQLNGKSILI